MRDHLHQWIIDFKRTKIKRSWWYYENACILLDTPASWQHCQHQHLKKSQNQHQHQHQQHRQHRHHINNIDINTQINNKLVSSNTSYRQNWNQTYWLDNLIYGKVSGAVESWILFASNASWDALKWFPDSLRWPLMHKLSKYVWHAICGSWPFGWETLFSPKNN